MMHRKAYATLLVLVPLVIAGCADQPLTPIGRDAGHLTLVAPASTTLTGEILTATQMTFTEAQCNEAAHYFSFSFTASGIATGPYPGTFTEQGTFAWEGGPFATFSSEFTISSDNTTITGTKTSSSLQPYSLCGEAFVFGNVNYDADIDGSRDEGTAFVIAAYDGSNPGVLQETFESTVVQSTPGKVTGGGHILREVDMATVSFGFNAQFTKDRGFSGSGAVVDHRSKTHVKLLDITSLVISGTHATIRGRAEIDGVSTTYTIDVDDLEKPLSETFKIVTASGFIASGPLANGSIQIRE